MDMSSESSAARWYEPPRSSLEPPSGGAGVAGVVGNPSDYRGYYPHAGPTAHHPAAAHYAHSKYTRVSFFSFCAFFFFFFFSSPRQSSHSLLPISHSPTAHLLFAVCFSSPLHEREIRVGSRFNDLSVDRPLTDDFADESEALARDRQERVGKKKRALPFQRRIYCADIKRIIRIICELF